MKNLSARKLWIIHLLTQSIAAVWATFDLRFESMVAPFGSLPMAPQVSIQAIADDVGWLRVVCFGIIVFGATTSLATLLAGIFQSRDNTGSRSIRSMLAITTVIAMWCGVAVNRHSLAWQGKRVRMAVQVNELETLTRSLRDDWPVRDGNLPGIGPFMAYPFGRPTTLVLLQAPPVLSESLCIAAIERRPDGAILLQLSGSSYDDWAEWHPAGHEPDSFVGGLSDPHELETSARLGKGWHLVRYQSDEAISGTALTTSSSAVNTFEPTLDGRRSVFVIVFISSPPASRLGRDGRLGTV